MYADRFPQEKIYLHFDRSVYNKGETIWFKAYLLAGFDPSTYSRNIYFDWFDANGRLLRHTAAPIYEASAKGQFDIPADYARVQPSRKGIYAMDAEFRYGISVQ